MKHDCSLSPQSLRVRCLFHHMMLCGFHCHKLRNTCCICYGNMPTIPYHFLPFPYHFPTISLKLGPTNCLVIVRYSFYSHVAANERKSLPDFIAIYHFGSIHNFWGCNPQENYFKETQRLFLIRLN
jgi:hypothetical protein